MIAGRRNLKRRNHRGSAADNPAIRTPQVRALHTEPKRGTHGAYSTVRLADLRTNSANTSKVSRLTRNEYAFELQLLIAKEADLQSKIAKIENGDPDALYIDRVVEMCAPKSTERLEQQQEKLETLRRKRDDLTGD